MGNENNNGLYNNDTVKILRLVEERINKLTDEKVIYQGERQYFGAGRIKGKNIGFTFTYIKKTSELGFQAESANENGVILLKKVFNKNKSLIEEQVGLYFRLDKGSKNENWYRLITKIFIDEGRDIIQQIDDLVKAFVRFKEIITNLAINDDTITPESNNIIEQENTFDYAKNIEITENQWRELLLDTSIFTEKDINLILLIYVMGGRATATDLSLIENTHPTSYNSWIISLSKRILNKLKINPPKRENGKEIYWCIPFIGQELFDNRFQWILRDNLYNVLEHLIYEEKIDINSAKNRYERGKGNLEKVRSDSWIDDTEIVAENYIGRKATDISSFRYGTTIPERYRKKFMENLSQEVVQGKGIKVNLIINNEKFEGLIIWPSSSKRKGFILQLRYSNKGLLELLREKLNISYDYIIKYEKENDKKPRNIPEEYEEYIDFYKGEEKDTFIIKLLPKSINPGIDNTDEDSGNDEVFDEPEIDVIEEDGDNFKVIDSVVEELEYIHKYILSKGFEYSQDLIRNFYISLKTKPFVILSGISGTGKSKIVELFAEAIGATQRNARFKLVPVKPDWSDSTDLLGYRNIEGKFTPGIITSVAYEAMKNPELPYFVCLDEMNLARVEYYFSDILSLMETRKLDDDGNIITEKLLDKVQFGRDERSKDSYGDVYIPQNMYIVGTVNMDETTFPFSKKVLDRANTIEFNKVNLEYSFDDVVFEDIERRTYKNDFLASKYLNLSQCREEKALAVKVIDKLVEINRILEEYNQHFGFRVRDEIVFYMIYGANERDKILDFDKALDNCIVQKILPKINGSNGDVLEILIRIYNLLNGSKYEYSGYIDDSQINEMMNKAKDSSYKDSSNKLVYMIRRFVRDGFTTFWQ